MNWTVLSSNLEYLYGRGMVERVGRHGKRIEYRLTLKGRSILQLYEGLMMTLGGLQGDQTHGHHRNRKLGRWNLQLGSSA